MALKVCKECGHELSSDAKQCPNCGKNVKKKHPIVAIILVTIGIVIICSALSSSDEPQSTLPNASENTSNEQVANIEYITISVDDLISDLSSNAAAAKDKYNGKYVILTGKLNVIDADISYIGLYPIHDSFSLQGVQCYTKNDEQRNVVKTLSKGDTITLKGKIKNVGEILGYTLDIIEIDK